MNSVELLIHEHDHILRMNKVIRSACAGIVEGAPVCVQDFRNFIDFVRNFADKHHHGKEEKILFKEMAERLGTLAKNLITHGMLVEHDWGRMYIADLEAALNAYENAASAEIKLDIIANAVGYANLLQRHIDRENAVVFTYAQKNLPQEVMDSIEVRSVEFEQQANNSGLQQKYLDVLTELESKYIRA